MKQDLKKIMLPNLSEIHTIVFDFDGIFTDNKVWLDQNGIETVRCDKSDSLGFDLLRSYIKKNNLKLDLMILSREKNDVVKMRAAKLQINCTNGIDNKVAFLKKYLINKFGEYEVSAKGLIYLGNDLNDLESIIFSGFSCVPNDSHEMIKKFASLVLNKNGGDGFLREFIEAIMNIDSLEVKEILDILS